MRRADRKVRTRIAVREAARACLEERGFEEVTVAEIARRAKVAAGTVYVHFPSKEELLDDLLREFNETLAEDVAARLARSAGQPLDVVIAAAADAFLDHWKEHRAFVEGYARRLAAGLTLEDMRDGINPPLARLLRAALQQELGPGGSVDVELLTQALLAVWLRLGMQYLFNPAVGRRKARTALIAITVASIEAAAERSRP